MFNAVYQFLEHIGYPHPIHPTEVHMPIGLIVGALVFRTVALLFGRTVLIPTARHCTLLAGIWLFPTVLFGYMDWQHFYAGAWLLPIKIKLGLAALLIVLVFASVYLAHKLGPASRLVWANYALSFAVVVVLGYFGGDLVYAGSQTKAPEAYMAGMKVFSNDCLACHPKGGNVVDPSLPLLNSPKTKDFETFLAFVRSPKRPNGAPGQMPSFAPAQLSDQDARELYEYVTHVLGPG